MVGFRRVAHLKRRVEIEITDPKLVDMASAAPLRALGHAASLVAFLPTHFLWGLFAGPQQEAGLPAAVQTPSAALKTDSLPATNTALSNLP